MPIMHRRKHASAEQDGPSRGRGRQPVIEQREFFLPDLNPAHDGLRIVQLTDIHVGRATPARRIHAAVQMANAFAPDLVVMTGDFLSHHERGVHLLRDQLAGLQAPVMAVLGNHDHWVDPNGAVHALRALHYTVLRNQNTTFLLRGEPFTVIGIDDLVTRNADIPRAFHGAHEGSRLVLAHVPRTAEYLIHYRASLCLAGHTHGGHINIPGLTPAIMRSVREHYIAGRFHVERTQLYVSRGLGGAVMPFRVNAPPEVTLLTLRSAHPDMRHAA
jgi:predicted MPP superfamily phosphohydrolase